MVIRGIFHSNSSNILWMSCLVSIDVISYGKIVSGRQVVINNNALGIVKSQAIDYKFAHFTFQSPCRKGLVYAPYVYPGEGIGKCASCPGAQASPIRVKKMVGTIHQVGLDGCIGDGGNRGYIIGPSLDKPGIQGGIGQEL